MRVAVIYNLPDRDPGGGHWLSRSDAASHPEGRELRDESETALLPEVAAITAVLERQGRRPLVFGADDTASLCRFLATEKPDLVFNCCEGLRGRSALEANVAALFELFDIPFTGSSATALALSLNKATAKALFRAHGIPTPRHAVAEDAADTDAADGLRFPLIVKPLSEDAGIGIDARSVVLDRAALAERVAFVVREFGQPALVEEFVDGRELNVSLLAGPSGRLAALPVSEISFDGLPDGVPRIVGYEAKWIRDSPCYAGTVGVCPADLAPSVLRAAEDLALRAAAAIGVRDYGRIDLRMRREDDALFVIEVNPNPDLNDDAGFLCAARAEGMTYHDTIARIVQAAVRRTTASTDSGRHVP